jgi:NAD(P)-dependent dehydrogenase (short-subunit alcohol dehydrogenase family)
MRLKDKAAVITGAASGMGLADARRFAIEGASLILTDVLDSAGKALSDELRAEGHQAVFVSHNVSDPADWVEVMRVALSQFGRINILVNNAGISGSAVPDVTEIDLFDRLIAVNLRGTFLGIRAVVPHMLATGGSIINISSICSHVGTPGVHVGYHASKGGIRALTKAAAAEFGPHKIRVNSIHPGAMPPMRDRQLTSHAARDKIIARVPLRRAGEVEDVANAVLFLASDESAYVNGAELSVDGGFLAT